MDSVKKESSEVTRMLERIEIKESFVCSLMDIVKESETMTRKLYTRSVYSGTICREIIVGALNTLEASIRLIQLLNTNVLRDKNNADAMTDTATGASALTVERVLWRLS